MQGPYFAIPGEINNHQFVLYLADGTALQASATLAAGDFKEVTDKGVAANVDTLPTNEGGGSYNWAQSAAESTAGSKVTMLCDDVTATETFLGTSLSVYVYTLAEVASKFYDGPFGPGIWMDPGGAAGSTLGTHGTEDNPTTTWANVKTLLGKLGVNRVYLKGGAAITLDVNVSDYEFVGIGEFSDNVITLGSQIYTTARFINCSVTGTGSASSGRGQFEKCLVNGVTNFHCIALACGFAGTTSLTNNDDHLFDQCYSMVAGGGTPILVWAANVDAGIRHHSGGWQFNSGGTTNDCSLEGHGQIILDASTDNFTMELRGAFKETDNGSGNTLNNVASFNRVAAASDANLISIDGVVLGTHEAGKVPVPVIAQYGDAVWFDTGTGAAGQVVGTNGTPINPSSVPADAVALAANGKTGLYRINILRGEAFTLGAPVANTHIFGMDRAASVAFASQALSNCILERVVVSGIQVTGGETNRFVDCALGGITYADDFEAFNCRIEGTQNLATNGSYSFARCYPGSGPGTFDFDEETSVTLQCEDWSGDITLDNMGDAGVSVTVGGSGTLTVTAACTAGTVDVNGDFDIVDNSGGAVTITTTSAGVNVTQLGGDSDRVTRLGQLLDDTEFATVTSQISVTQFIATGLTSTAAETYINRRGVMISGVNKGAPFDCVGYDGATKTMTVDPLHFTPALNDTFILLA